MIIIIVENLQNHHALKQEYIPIYSIVHYFIIVIKINNMKYSNVQMDFILIRNYSCVQHLNWFVYWIEILTRNFSFRFLQINCQYEPPMVSTITDDEIDTTSTIESGHFLISIQLFNYFIFLRYNLSRLCSWYSFTCRK